MKKLLVLLFLFCPFTAGAVTYQWTDSRGTINFTEDLGKVPKKYRKKVKVLGVDESGAPQIIDSVESAKGKGKDPVAHPPAGKEKTGTSAKEDAAQRNEYLSAKVNLQAMENNVADLKARLADNSKMSRSEYLSLQNTLKQEEYRVLEQKKRVEQLRDSAARSGASLDAK
ncbi:hypothetical protein GMLC_03640 [Geomonas limicola]|uniref:DUF4124 domain-containing protein n=1 Tax=Geomonas limicola TaxID=2740186 RepID=A0A6V8N2L1_9BACT|nr:DUF4124 domain-containing protein [Geomonas limicola]GFO66785.1 hypothetical protein GMLC_03640 [Geomonas limicola]